MSPPPLPSHETLPVERHGDHVLLVTLNRPEVLNAIDAAMGQALHELVMALQHDPGNLRAVVLTGAGRAFCTGADLKARHGQGRDEMLRQHGVAERTFEALIESPLPWIAAVNGPCWAGGLEAALSCDFIFAARDASFALSECRIGLMPGCMGTQTLARAVGERRAKELILSARSFSAAEAQRWGMVNELTEPADLLPAALACAQRIAACAPLSVRQAKKAIHQGLQADLHSGYRFELEAWRALLGTEDLREGIAAFVEKREPRFLGR